MKNLMLALILSVLFVSTSSANEVGEKIKEACDVSTFETPSENGDIESLSDKSIFTFTLLKAVAQSDSHKYLTKAYPLFLKNIQVCEVKGKLQAQGKPITQVMIQLQCEVLVQCGLLMGFTFY